MGPLEHVSRSVGAEVGRRRFLAGSLTWLAGTAAVLAAPGLARAADTGRSLPQVRPAQDTGASPQTCGIYCYTSDCGCCPNCCGTNTGALYKCVDQCTQQVTYYCFNLCSSCLGFCYSNAC